MRRIQRDVCHDELLKTLTSGDAPLFKEIWRIMLFAAALGVYEGRRRPIEKADSGKAIPESYFSSPGWRGVLYLIGVAETGDSQCLHGTEQAQDALVMTFEEYANHGLHRLSERLSAGPSIMDSMIGLLVEASLPRSAKPDVSDLI